MTLVEIMMAFAVFSVVAGGVVGTLTQSRKFAEISIYHATAQTIAQSIIEQIQLMPYNTLADEPNPGEIADPIPLQFAAAASSNTATLQTFSLNWATDDGSPENIQFKAIGEVVGGDTKGILLDMDLRSSAGTVIRKKKYMQMLVNIKKKVNAGNGNVVVTLTYKWEIPYRKASTGLPVYESRQIRAVRSITPSY